jgi:hypothetical protein
MDRRIDTARRPLDDGFGCRLTEAGERLMYRRDQRRELVKRGLVSPKICGDDFRGGRCRRRFVGASWFSCRTNNIPHPRNRGGI